MATGEEIANGTSIKQIFQGMVGEGAEVLQGIVKSENPLKIQIVNDDKLVVGPNNVYVPRHLTDYTATVDIIQGDGSVDGSTATDGAHGNSYSGTTGTGGDPSHVHAYSGEAQGAAHSHALSTFNIHGAKMTVYNALKAGEQVHVLSFNHGKQYFVLDRVN